MGCRVGKKCLQAGDCASAACVKGICAPAPRCANKVKDGGESDTDCGGRACLPCAHGRACTERCDCAQPFCHGGICTSCTDNRHDGDESDRDCGGSCPKCALGRACGADGDCQSGSCESGWCDNRPLCLNKKLDGLETDLDRGGPACDRCADGRKCKADDDCLSGLCVNQVCGKSNCGCKQGSFCKNGFCNCDGRSCGTCCDGEFCGFNCQLFGGLGTLIDLGRGSFCGCLSPINTCSVSCPNTGGTCCTYGIEPDFFVKCVKNNSELCLDPKTFFSCMPCACD
ncbi:MAG: hypothetical protein EXR72_13865 [Myxococcales bacterium]|nr:hypothetical protein [Myxococcales bacterium]